MDGNISQGDFLDNAETTKPTDPTAAERQRRYRERNGMSTTAPKAGR